MPSSVDTPVLPLVEIRVVGPLDASAAARVQHLLVDAVTLRPDKLVVDLSGCDAVDATGIGVLVDAHRAVWRYGGLMRLQGVSPHVLRILDIARVGQILHTKAS